jgi:hypothetical protein
VGWRFVAEEYDYLKFPFAVTFVCADTTLMATSGRRILVRFLAAGVIVPCVLFSFILLFDFRFEGPSMWVVLIPWPTAVMLMAAEGSRTDMGLFLAFFFSTAANVLLYGVIGGLAAFFYRKFSTPT